MTEVMRDETTDDFILYCPCGEKLSSNNPPYKYKPFFGWFSLFWRDDHCQSNDESLSHVKHIANNYDVWECNSCGRLGFDDVDAGNNPITWFSPDSGRYEKLCDFERSLKTKLAEAIKKEGDL